MDTVRKARKARKVRASAAKPTATAALKFEIRAAHWNLRDQVACVAFDKTQYVVRIYWSASVGLQHNAKFDDAMAAQRLADRVNACGRITTAMWTHTFNPQLGWERGN